MVRLAHGRPSLLFPLGLSLLLALPALVQDLRYDGTVFASTH